MAFSDNRRRNEAKPCAAPGCQLPRRSIAKYCATHHKPAEHWGHPSGRAIRTREYAYERQLVSDFIARHTEHLGVVAALGLIQRWLDAATMREDDSEASQEWSRLAAYNVKPLDILTTSAALVLLSRWNARLLPDDQRLTFQVGYRVLKLAPCNRRATFRRGKSALVSITPGKVARRAVGSRIRTVLGALLLNIAEAIIAAYEAQKQTVRELHTPF